jgi:hypothetical protein
MKKLFPLLTITGLLFWGLECNGQKDFDVVRNRLNPKAGVYPSDANGLPLNPKWGQQARENTLPNPFVSCPPIYYKKKVANDGEILIEDWTKISTYPNCTNVPVSFNGGYLCGLHVNFEYVTYEGFVTWDVHSADDDDYDLNVTSDPKYDSALYSTADSRVHIEFDSDETVDNWDDTNTWWNDFHHNGVDHCYWAYDPFGHHVCIGDGDAQASKMINDSFVIVIGLLGLDTAHRAKTEIHPVYAMFVNLKSSTWKRSNWAFFVRNWGDEGFCSDGDEPFETSEHKIKVYIPNVAGLISQNVSDGAQNADQDQLSQMEASMQPYGDGVLMTFTLLPPDKQSWFVGDLTFARKPRQSISAATTAPAPQSGRNPSGETEPEERLDPDLQALKARIAKLPADSRIELYRQLQYLTPRKKSSPVKVVVLFEPAKDEDVHPSAPAKAIPPRTSRPSGTKSTVELHRQKKIEFIKQYLAETEKKTQ